MPQLPSHMNEWMSEWKNTDQRTASTALLSGALGSRSGPVLWFWRFGTCRHLDQTLRNGYSTPPPSSSPSSAGESRGRGQGSSFTDQHLTVLLRNRTSARYHMDPFWDMNSQLWDPGPLECLGSTAAADPDWLWADRGGTGAPFGQTEILQMRRMGHWKTPEDKKS